MERKWVGFLSACFCSCLLLPRLFLLCLQAYIMDGQLYDTKCLETGGGLVESEQDLESCAMLLNKKKVGAIAAVVGGTI